MALADERVAGTPQTGANRSSTYCWRAATSAFCATPHGVFASLTTVMTGFWPRSNCAVTNRFGILYPLSYAAACGLRPSQAKPAPPSELALDRHHLRRAAVAHDGDGYH